MVTLTDSARSLGAAIPARGHEGRSSPLLPEATVISPPVNIPSAGVPLLPPGITLRGLASGDMLGDAHL